ncbi:MAG: hypothetical protein QXO33_04125 [Nitrososphaeria archaeon]
MKEKTILKLAGIIAITYLETLALIYLKMDSALLASVIAVIAGLVGYEVGKKGKSE